MAHSQHVADGEVPGTSKSFLDTGGFTVPLVIRSLNKERTLREVNGEYIRRLLSEILGKSHDRAYFDRNGCLVVHASNRSAFSRLMALTFLCGVLVKAEVPRWFNRNMGRITGVPVKFNERQLLNFLAPFGVIYLRRQCTESQKRDGSIKVTPTDILEVNFWPGRPVPQKVAIDRTLYAVQPILPPLATGSQGKEFNH